MSGQVTVTATDGFVTASAPISAAFWCLDSPQVQGGVGSGVGCH
jgi:hypothetical protein